MLSHVRIVLGLLVCGAWVSASAGEAPPAKPKVKVEFRWVESKPIEGLTEEEGFQCSCDPKDIVYPHTKPALAVTAADVAAVDLKNLDYSKNGLSSENYSVAIHLTQAARARLAATVDGKQMKLLTVLVDGKYWGVHRYEKDQDKPGVPEQARAASFVALIGYFSSKSEAQRVVDALQ